MELTGPRRIVHTTLFATVAWAGYFILFLASWNGVFVTGYYDAEMLAFYASSPFSTVLALAAVVIAALAIQRPTTERARASSRWLAVLVVLAALHGYVQSAMIDAESPVRVVRHAAGDVVRVAVWLVPVGGVVIATVVDVLERWEQRTRAKVFGACGV